MLLSENDLSVSVTSDRLGLMHWVLVRCLPGNPAVAGLSGVPLFSEEGTGVVSNEALLFLPPPEENVRTHASKKV